MSKTKVSADFASDESPLPGSQTSVLSVSLDGTTGEGAPCGLS